MDDLNVKTPTGPALQVLVLGMPRTSTTSLRLALRELGYTRGYNWECIDQFRGHRSHWDWLLQRKFETGEAITQQDFEMCLRDFTNVGDWPASLLAKDLVEAYPNAKVILTVRDSADAWYHSFEKTVWSYMQPAIKPKNLWERYWKARGRLSRFHQILLKHTPIQDFPRLGQQWYLDHNKALRDLVPPERLLEFNAKQGWGPLCEFLGKDLPLSDFPQNNDSTIYASLMHQNLSDHKARIVSRCMDTLSTYSLAVAVAFGLAYLSNLFT